LPDEEPRTRAKSTADSPSAVEPVFTAEFDALNAALDEADEAIAAVVGAAGESAPFLADKPTDLTTFHANQLMAARHRVHAAAELLQAVAMRLEV